jgi:hypothetical protein
MADRIEQHTAKNTFAIVGVSCSEDSFVVAESSVLRICICGKNPAHRKSAKRYPPTLLQNCTFTFLIPKINFQKIPSAGN